MTHEKIRDEQEFFMVLQKIESNTYYFSESRKQRLQTLGLYADRLEKVWRQQEWALASRGRKMLNYCYSMVPVGDKVYHINREYQLVLVPFDLSGIRVNPYICTRYFDDHAVRDIMSGGSAAGEILTAMRQNLLFYAEIFFPKAMDMMYFPYELSKEEACRSTRCLQDIFRYIGENSVYAGQYQELEKLHPEQAVQERQNREDTDQSRSDRKSADKKGWEVRDGKDDRNLSGQKSALLQQLRTFQEKEHGELSDCLEKVCLRYEALLRYTDVHTEQQYMLKKTESYYLPTLLKLLQDTGRDFEDDRELLQRTAGSVAKALERLEEDIKEPERMRRQAESDTLIWMMKQDGVLEGDIRSGRKKDDPFTS